jgi:uncharacterized membrane protein YfcA
MCRSVVLMWAADSQAGLDSSRARTPSLAATVVFAARGLIDWRLGFILSFVSFAGAAFGAMLARNLSNAFLRRVFLIAIVAVAVKTLVYDIQR